MKRHVFPALLLLFSLLLSGCSIIKNTEPEITTTSITILTTVPEVETTKPSNTDAPLDPLFEEVLGMYYSAAKDKNSFMELEEQGISPWLEACYEEDPLQSIGYQVADIDGNSSNELIIGAILGEEAVRYMVFTVFTIYNGELEEVFCSEERDRFYSCDGYEFLNEGSNGAGNSITIRYKLEGTKLTLTDGVVYDESAFPGKSPWYRTTTQDAALLQENNLTEEEATSLLNQLRGGRRSLVLIPLSEFHAK